MSNRRFDGGVGEHLGEQSLGEAGGPAGAKLTAIDDRRNQFGRSGECRYSKVGPVGLGERLNPNGLVGVLSPDALKLPSGVPALGIFDDECARAVDDRREFGESCLADLCAGGIVRPGLNDDCPGRSVHDVCEGGAADAVAVHRHADHRRAERLQRVEQRRVGGVFHNNRIAE